MARARVCRVRVAVGAGVQEERGKRAQRHDPEQQEDRSVQQPPDQARREEAVAEEHAGQEPQGQVVARAGAVPQQVAEQQEGATAHAHRDGQGGRQLPDRPAVGGLVEVAAGDQQRDQRHDRQDRCLPGRRDRPGPDIGPGDARAVAVVDRAGDPDADGEHGQVDDHREPPGLAPPAAQPVSAQQQEQRRAGLHGHARPRGVEPLLAQAAGLSGGQEIGQATSGRARSRRARPGWRRAPAPRRARRPAPGPCTGARAVPPMAGRGRPSASPAT